MSGVEYCMWLRLARDCLQRACDQVEIDDSDVHLSDYARDQIRKAVNRLRPILEDDESVAQ